MKKKFIITFFYTSYLVMLGQGCSILQNDESGLLIELPEISMPAVVSLPGVPALKTSAIESSAPKTLEEITLVKEIPSQLPSDVEKPSVTEVSQKDTYVSSRYRFATNFRDQGLVSKKIASPAVPKMESIKPIVKKIKIIKISNNKVTSSSSKIAEENNLSDKENIESENEKEQNKLLLNSKIGFNHYGFNLENQSELLSTTWMVALNGSLAERLAFIEVDSNDSKKMKKSQKENSLAYQPSATNTVDNFVNDEEDFSDIIKKTDSSVVKSDEMVFLDYSKATGPEKKHIDSEKEQEPANGKIVASTVGQQSIISNVVRRVIDREMASEGTSSKNSNLIAIATAGSRVSGNIDKIARDLYSTKTTNSSKQKRSKLQNQATLYAIESDLKKGFQESVTNFDFVPSHNSNNSLRDFNEGSITVDYSLVNQTGLLRGTILKNYFMRTTFEIPLGSEYSKFEIPLIPKDSLGDYLDKNELDGYGGYYLVDLGDLIEDVDVEKTSNDKQPPYEHRLLLDEDFKPVKTGSEYRYVLFIGVIPGSINVRYLGVNGQETSKLTFITADEVTYDFSQIERPHLLNFTTRVRNTLGTSTSPLDLSVSSITSFLDDANPIKVSGSSYEIKVPWSVKGMRNYFRFNYLEDDLYVGVDRDQNIELPSKEFIGEILRSFNMESLSAECVLQMNFSETVSEIQIQAENDKGPANFDHTYLDRDGVFTPEISSLSEKFFAIGYEEGIFSIKITYEDGRSDFLRTYCSPTTYLLEQL
jgi:hypothetical protein